MSDFEDAVETLDSGKVDGLRHRVPSRGLSFSKSAAEGLGDVSPVPGTSGLNNDGHKATPFRSLRSIHSTSSYSSPEHFPHVHRSVDEEDDDEEEDELREVRELLQSSAVAAVEVVEGSVKEALEDDEEEAAGGGCPLPSTPEEDDTLLTHEITEALREGKLIGDLEQLGANGTETAEELLRRVYMGASWGVCHFHHLPKWLQDNDFLRKGHRPPLPSFHACFRSIFRVHTETGNIWTHLLSCVAFIVMEIYVLTRPSIYLTLWDKLAFACFLNGAILCLGLSFLFHTLHCHSEFVGKLFSKLDYCGIATLIMGSYVPWLYYGFYCESKQMLIYLSVVLFLGISSFVVSLWDRFSEPRFRALRAGVFMGFGLSGVIPAVHYAVSQGWLNAVNQAALGPLILMGALYILGALFYTLRIPERFFPGSCDIIGQSHQIFHILVFLAALVHFYGISEMAMYRMAVGECADPPPGSATSSF
ncbi:adiponectin receptor protein [Ischnura elegans]|uniref:adiponectin receptor protein n=1 Tax=Ischnura elegans TaxID=197161 RepID=UPI001ED8B923|nr:adiponectin receptor protein [Ischnura elegans]XP_046401250.1 adiponectin receptor protein [Ischnura elegans]XP_046401251.1 adiponectin receptor protein [Ischnura elegans]